MDAPATPPDEAARLATLRALALLDTDAEERFDRVTRIAQRLFGVPVALVSLIDEDRQWFKSRQGVEEIETPREISFCGHAILGDDLFTVPDASADQRFADNPLVEDDPSIRFYAGCPIKAPNGTKLGTLCVIDDEPRQFSTLDEQMLRDLAEVIEAEVAAASLATVDELTGLANRRGFEVVGRKVVDVCDRLDRPVTVLYADLDGLKRINDTAGHAAGDRAIRTFADLLGDTFRSSDVVARLGGDEFAVLFVGTGSASTVEHHLEDAVAEHNAGRPEHQISYSVGVVIREPGSEETLDELVRRADAAMYEHKQRGSGT